MSLLSIHSPGADSVRGEYSYRLALSGVTVLFTAWFCIGLLFYLPDNGGSGLLLPFNIVSWAVIALATLWLALTLPAGSLRVSSLIPWRTSRRDKKVLWLLPAGAVLWSLPLIWSPSSQARTESLPHVAALWGLLGFLWLLRRLPVSALRLRHWLTILWCATLLQGLFGFLQIEVFAHHGGFTSDRPFGIFQQANVQASFLATGLACLLYCQFFIAKGGLPVRFLAGFTAFFLPFMLVLLDSRVGWIGALLAAVLLSVVALQHKTEARVLRRQWLLMLAGAVLAVLLAHGVLDPLLQKLFSENAIQAVKGLISARDTASSNHERLYILQTTWQMIGHHPLAGGGYGSFEAAFARETVASGGFFHPATLIHPHNELLFAWVEGGVCALAGLLMMIGGIVGALWQKGGFRWCGIALLLPIALHMNLEYPLYQSVPHGMALVILLSLILSPGIAAQSLDDTATDRHHNASRLLTFVQGEGLRAIAFITGLVMLIVMAGALQTQQALVQVERQELFPLVLDEEGTLDGLWNAPIFANRIDYDRHVALLMRFNKTHDARLLGQFDQWAAAYLTRHNDPNVFLSRLMIARAQTPAKASAICQQAHRLWQDDKRFTCAHP
jgi:O-antigen polymerase